MSKLHHAFVALCTAMFLAAGPASAHSVTGTYTLASTPGVSFQTSVAGANLGGVRFEANGEQPVRVDIADASNGPVSFTVCQDFNGQLCGEAGEPVVAGCGKTVDLSPSAVAFNVTIDLLVFVRITSQGCTGPATSGSITVTYVP